MKAPDLPHCAPEEVGISSRQVERCIRALNHEYTTMNGFMAARHGKVFSQCWWAPFSCEMPHSNHSLGKTYTATAIGIAMGEGLLDLDEKITDIFGEKIRQEHLAVPPGLEKITVRHILTMTNGMAYNPDMRGDFVANYLTTPLAYEPGTHFSYNSTGSCMLGAIILLRTGQNLKEYLTPRLFQKIGIDPERFVWRQFRGTGIDGEPGTFSTTEDNLRLAMCYLDGGRWEGEQVIPERYVREALQIQISTAHAPEQRDGRCGYGYQLWACSKPGVFRFDGGQGQYCLLWPEKDLVISLHEGALGPLGPQKTLDVLYETLLNDIADVPLPRDGAALASLRETEVSRALEAAPGTEVPPDGSFSGTYQVTDGTFDPWLSASPPGSGDLFQVFRTPEKDVPIRRFSLLVQEQVLRLVLDTGAELEARWDGTLTAGFVDSPYDQLGDYAATARCMADGSLTLHIHWLNGWFETEITFSKTTAGLAVTTRKLRLNAEDNFLVYLAQADKTGA